MKTVLTRTTLAMLAGGLMAATAATAAPDPSARSRPGGIIVYESAINRDGTMSTERAKPIQTVAAERAIKPRRAVRPAGTEAPADVPTQPAAEPR